MSTLLNMYVTSNTEVQSVLLALLLSFVLGTIIALIYKHTNKGFSYESSFAFTLIMIAMIITAIMITIGSNVALSLGLIGSLSIIRFRTAIKNSIDMAYLFWIIAVGLASGAQNFPVAVATTLFIGGIVFVMNRWGGFFHVNTDYILVVQVKSKHDGTSIPAIFADHHLAWKLKSSFVNKEGSELTYSIFSKRKEDADEILREVNSLSSVHGASLLSPDTNLYI